MFLELQKKEETIARAFSTTMNAAPVKHCDVPNSHSIPTYGGVDVRDIATLYTRATIKQSLGEVHQKRGSNNWDLQYKTLKLLKLLEVTVAVHVLY